MLRTNKDTPPDHGQAAGGDANIQELNKETMPENTTNGKALDKELVRQAVTVPEMFRHYGYDVALDEGRIVCPLCGNDNGKKDAEISERNFHCHKCCKCLDVYDVVQEFENCSLCESVAIVAEIGELTELTPDKQAQLDERKAQAAERRKSNLAQQEQWAKEAAKIAQGMWDEAGEAPDTFPYLQKKKVPSIGLRYYKGWLLMAARDADGNISTMHQIDANGKKLFLSCGKKQGCFFVLPTTTNDHKSTLYISEGYATAASVYMALKGVCTVIVAFDAGNLLSVAKIARVKYPQREIVIVADNDEKPLWKSKHNVGVEKAIIAARAIDCQIAIPALSQGGKCDFNDLHIEEGLEAVRTQIKATIPPPPIVRQAVEVPTVPVEKLPLRKKPQEQEAYPVEALGIFADVVVAFAECIKVPVPMAAASVLTALAMCTQHRANVVTRDGRYIPIVLFFLTIADSGDRKSAIDRVALYAVHGEEKQWYTAYQAELQQWEANKAAWLRLPKKERDMNPFAEEPPKIPMLMVENSNVEGTFRLLKEGRPSMIVITDEGGILFGGHSFQKENVLKTITFYSAGWDGKALDKSRGGEGYTKLYDRRLSMSLMVQPRIADAVLNDAMIDDQGFTNRFLLSWPKSLRGTRTYNGEDVRKNPHVQRFYAICSDLLQDPLHLDKSTGGLMFEKLYLDDDAHKLWKHHHDNIELMLDDDGELFLIKGLAAKNAEQALRIAGVLTLAHDKRARTITAPIMGSAVKLAQWYLKEALRLKQDGVTPQEILKAEKLLNWIQANGYTHISIRLVQRNTGFDTKAKAEPVIKTLVEHGYLRKGSGNVLIDKTPTKTFWEVVA